MNGILKAEAEDTCRKHKQYEKNIHMWFWQRSRMWLEHSEPRERAWGWGSSGCRQALSSQCWHLGSRLSSLPLHRPQMLAPWRTLLPSYPAQVGKTAGVYLPGSNSGSALFLTLAFYFTLHPLCEVTDPCLLWGLFIPRSGGGCGVLCPTWKVLRQYHWGVWDPLLTGAQGGVAGYSVTA